MSVVLRKYRVFQQGMKSFLNPLGEEAQHGPRYQRSVLVRAGDHLRFRGKGARHGAGSAGFPHQKLRHAGADIHGDEEERHAAGSGREEVRAVREARLRGQPEHQRDPLSTQVPSPSSRADRTAIRAVDQSLVTVLPKGK